MDREELRNFFADVRSCLNISLGSWLDRNHIYRSEFSNFMKGQYNNIPDEKLKMLQQDLINNIKSFLELYKKVG